MSLSDKFFQRGRDFLGVEYPFICGAMTWVSDPKLVAAVCNAGAFACLAGGNTPVDILEEQVEETKALTDKPFAVNLITIAPAYHSHLEMLKRVKLDYVVFAGGFPRAAVGPGRAPRPGDDRRRALEPARGGTPGPAPGARWPG